MSAPPTRACSGLRRHRPWRWVVGALSLVGARACGLRSTHSRLLGVALRPPVARVGVLLLEVFAGGE